MYQVLAIHPNGTERVVNTFNDWQKARDWAETLQADDNFFMYEARVSA